MLFSSQNGYFQDRGLGRPEAPDWCSDRFLMFVRMFWHGIRRPRAFAGTGATIARPEEQLETSSSDRWPCRRISEIMKKQGKELKRNLLH